MRGKRGALRTLGRAMDILPTRPNPASGVGFSGAYLVPASSRVCPSVYRPTDECATSAWRAIGCSRGHPGFSGSKVVPGILSHSFLVISRKPWPLQALVPLQPFVEHALWPLQAFAPMHRPTASLA